MTYLPAKSPPWRDEVNPLGPPAAPSTNATPLDAGTMVDLEARVETGLEGVAAAAQLLTGKGQPNGYASLDGSGDVPLAQMSPSVPFVSSPTSEQSPEWNGSAWVGKTHMAIESSATPFTLYVSQGTGSDVNTGDSPGRALQTVATALAKFNTAAHGGRILILGVQQGAQNVAAPLHLIGPVTINAMMPQAFELRRNFTTPNSRSVYDAVTTAGGTSVSSATAAFVAGDVNNIVEIYGAGVGGGTFYDFISSQAGATATFANATTAVAKNSSTDPAGVRLRVLGDWTRVVTDAAITAPGAGNLSVVTSATANFTGTDVGTEIVIAGADQGGQALRTVIQSVQSTTQCTVIDAATNAVATKRMVIGLNGGDLITLHSSQASLSNLTLNDVSTGDTTIGAPIKFTCNLNGGQTTIGEGLSQLDRITIKGSGGATGPWEHCFEVDASNQQRATGPGWRDSQIDGLQIFGFARRATETIRINSAVHMTFMGGGIVTNPPAIAAGILILDPQQTGASQRGCADVHFAGFHALGSYFYCEGQYCTYTGGRLGPSVAVSGRNAIHLTSASDHCLINTVNTATTNTLEVNAGTNNTVRTNQSPVGAATLITSTNATWPIPSGAGLLEITCVGGGGGGGGGGSSSAGATQVGGSGGSSGVPSTQIVTVGVNTTLNVTVGGGGGGGGGGSASGNAGNNGSAGTATTVTGTGISVRGGQGGFGVKGLANSSAAATPVLFGGNAAGGNPNVGSFAGNGGAANSTSGVAGGDPIAYTGGGGGGGGVTTATNGGAAGNAGSATAGGAGVGAGGSGTTTGGTAANAAANTGAGGGGGGGGAWNGGTGPGAGGAGGNGGSGLVVIRIVG